MFGDECATFYVQFDELIEEEAINHPVPMNTKHGPEVTKHAINSDD